MVCVGDYLQGPRITQKQQCHSKTYLNMSKTTKSRKPEALYTACRQLELAFGLLRISPLNSLLLFMTPERDPQK